MPSLISYTLRLPIRFIANRMDSITSLSKLRELAATGSRRPIHAPGVRRETVDAGGVPAEWIGPTKGEPQKVLLYLHGGGWIMGWYNAHRWMVGYLARVLGRRALAVDYRLAPEHPFPAGLDDCLAAYRWLLQNGTPARDIVIAGDSAGGNLTLTTMLALRDAGDPLPAAAVCLSPGTDLEAGGESFRADKDPMLHAAMARRMLEYYLADNDPHAPLLSPLYGDLHGLPPLLIQVGEDELLLSDCTRFAERARAAGVEIRLEIWPRMWHVWQIFVPVLPEANKAIRAIAAFVRERAGK